MKLISTRGLAVVFAEDVATVQNADPPGKFISPLSTHHTESHVFTASWDALCPTFDALPDQTFP